MILTGSAHEVGLTQLAFDSRLWKWLVKTLDSRLWKWSKRDISHLWKRYKAVGVISH